MELKKSDCLTAGDFKKYELVKAFCDKINKNIKVGNLIFTPENQILEGEFGFDYIGHTGFGITVKARYQHLFGTTKAKEVKGEKIDKFTISESVQDIKKYFNALNVIDPKSFKSL